MAFKEKRIVIRNKEGRFFKAGYDCRDSWVKDPLEADDRSSCLYEKDALFENPSLGDLVEIEVTAKLTGKKRNDLYKNGKLLPDYQSDTLTKERAIAIYGQAVVIKAQELYARESGSVNVLFSEDNYSLDDNDVGASEKEKSMVLKKASLLYPIAYNFIIDDSDGTFDFTNDLGIGGDYVGLDIALERDEKIVADVNGVLTIVGGRFGKFILNKKFRFNVSCHVDSTSDKKMGEYISKIGANVSDRWSIIIYENQFEQYEAAFYFRRKVDALMFKMST